VALSREISLDAAAAIGLRALSDTQFVDAFHRLTAGSAEERAAVATQQGNGNRLGAVGQ